MIVRDTVVKESMTQFVVHVAGEYNCISVRYTLKAGNHTISR